MTRFTAVQKLTHFCENKAIDTYHFVMFHGLSRRGDKVGGKSYFLKDQLEEPLSLEINAYRQNHIIQPSGRLVVSEQVKAELGSIQNIIFFPTDFAKIFTIPYKEFDFSHWDDADYYDDGLGPERVVNRASHLPELVSEILPMFEVICARHVDVKNEFQNLVDIEVSIGPTIHDRPFIISLSRQMLETYPIMWCSGCHILSEDLYGKINKYFNWNYLIKYEAAF